MRPVYRPREPPVWRLFVLTVLVSAVLTSRLVGAEVIFAFDSLRPETTPVCDGTTTECLLYDLLEVLVASIVAYLLF